MSKEKIAKNFLKHIIQKTLTLDANRTSCAIIYQPKAPEKLKEFKKIV